MQIRIVDPETGEPVATGERGEIAVKGITLMKGYHKVDPELYLDAEGFFRTQDGGYFDDEGYRFSLHVNALPLCGRCSGYVLALMSPAGAESQEVAIKYFDFLAASAARS